MYCIVFKLIAVLTYWFNRHLF